MKITKEQLEAYIAEKQRLQNDYDERKVLLVEDVKEITSRLYERVEELEAEILEHKGIRS